MSQIRTPGSGSTVDWNSPDLQKLLAKTADWGLDNRGVYTPTACELHVGWGAGVGRDATLVYERDGIMVVETTFAIPQGESVRVDRIGNGGLRSTWGVVADGRQGNRVEDQTNGIWVHWIRPR